jgi:hypothetical protein
LLGYSPERSITAQFSNQPRCGTLDPPFCEKGIQLLYLVSSQCHSALHISTKLIITGKKYKINQPIRQLLLELAEAPTYGSSVRDLPTAFLLGLSVP